MFHRNYCCERHAFFEERNNFIHSYKFRWIVKFSIGIILLTREISNFLKSDMVLTILTWLICIAQVFKSPHTKCVCVCIYVYV